MRALIAVLFLAAAAAVGAPAVGKPTSRVAPPVADCRVGNEDFQSGPSWSGDGRWVAYVTYVWPGPRSAFVAVGLARGGRSSIVHESKESELSFRWAPRGARMIITDGREMYLASSTGRVRRIGRGCFGAWAPDGSRIAYAANGWIYTSRPDGSDARRLVEGVNVRDWSSDGKRILFLRVVERPGCRVLRLFVLRPGTGRAVQLTGNTRLDRDGVEHERPGQRWGHFSADGRYVAFAEFRACDSGGVPEYEPHAFVADPATQGARQVGRGTPTWSTGSARLAVGGWYSNRLIVLTPGAREIASLPVNQATLAPNGGRIIHISPQRGRWGLYLLAVRGTPPGRLLVDRVDWDAAWSPDGKRVAFVRSSSGCVFANEVHVVSIATRQTRRVIPFRCRLHRPVHASTKDRQW